MAVEHAFFDLSPETAFLFLRSLVNGQTMFAAVGRATVHLNQANGASVGRVDSRCGHPAGAGT